MPLALTLAITKRDIRTRPKWFQLVGGWSRTTQAGEAVAICHPMVRRGSPFTPSLVADEPVAAHMDTVATQQGEGVTYLRRERDWLAVSGLKGGRIFYRKAVIACGGNMWHHIAFE